ncbi:MAG: hypothetical protein ACYC6O_04445 [Thermoleophilia bacterium]
MTRILSIFVVVVVLMLALASPALAVTGADGAGRAFGEHHSTHAKEMGGFTGVMNPGVMHQGFSGWPGG